MEVQSFLACRGALPPGMEKPYEAYETVVSGLSSRLINGTVHSTKNLKYLEAKTKCLRILTISHVETS